jgi:hypothetical protein
MKPPNTKQGVNKTHGTNIRSTQFHVTLLLARAQGQTQSRTKSTIHHGHIKTNKLE